MAIVRTAKGTASAYNDATDVDRVELASVAIANGASVIVLISSHKEFGNSTSVTWNGQALTQDAAITNASGARVEVWSKHNVTGATGTVSAIWPVGKIAFGLTMAVVQVEGLATASVIDKVSTASGLGISPSSGATATTTQADEYLVGLVGSALAGVDVGGTWDNSFSAGQAINDENSIALSEGYRTVSATGAYTASKTAAVSGQWAAAIATYKADLTQTLTPSTVAGSGAAILASLAIGVAAAVAGVGAVGLVNTNVFVPTTVSGKGAAVRPESAGVVADSYNPSTPTPLTVNILGAVGMALRPTTPATLGDQQRNSQEDSGHVMGAGSGDINLFATVVQDAQGDLSGTISFLRLYGYVSTRDDVPAGTYVACTAEAFIVKVSGGARTPYGLVSGTIPATMGLADGPMWTSADLTTRPAGGAWTWTDINNLVELGVTAHYTLGVGNFTNLRLDEVWLEVWGPQGSQVAPLTRVLKAGNLKRQFNIIETFNL